MNNKAALYVRVSTTHQIDKDSLPFQRDELINYSKYVLGIDDFEIFEDAGFSGKDTVRPKYQEMMNRIKAKEFSHLLVWKIDRISRNLKDFTEMYEDLKKQGVTFISKNEQFDTSSAMGEAMLKIILVFAELERKLTGERVFSIMLSRAEKGLWNGATVPLGYQWSPEEKFPVIDDTEAETVKYIYNLYESLASTSKVAFRLNGEKVKTKRGGKWTAKTINDVLRNPFYIGTYRYNTKESGTRRWKDEDEWVVVEDNHPGLISKEQFEKVNQMLTDNYRGNVEFQRANTNTHMFSKMIYCSNCKMSMNAGLDRARKDGYRPSRYTCYSNHFTDNITSCNNYVSDITLMPFILNYISNFINLQEKITINHSLRDIERILLRGKYFVDIKGIDRKGLEATKLAFISGFQDKKFDKNNDKKVSEDLELQSLKKEKIKYEKALERLEDLFLFSEESMAKKDFIFKKRDLAKNLETVNNKISENYKSKTNTKTDFEFLTKVSNFFMKKHISIKQDIDYRKLLKGVDKEVLREFILLVIEKIVVDDKKVSSITFKNGITHNFAYKAIEKMQRRSKQRFLYKEFEPMVLDYIKENESVNRVEVEKITAMSRTGALSIINELMDRNLIVKKGNSVATRYFLNKKTT